MVLDEPKPSDQQIVQDSPAQETGKIVILIDPTTDIYLDSRMRLDFDPVTRQFLFRSANLAMPYRMRL